MRSAGEYLKEADVFDAMARATSDPPLRRRLADIAECYRLLARERERLAADGAIHDDERPSAEVQPNKA